MPRDARPLWHHGNQCWYARIGEPDAKGRARAVYFRKPLAGGVQPPRDRRDEAAAWAYFEALRTAERARSVTVADPTVTGLGELYLAACQARVAEGSLKAGSLAGFRTRLRKFAGFEVRGREIGRRKAASITVDDLDEWARKLKGWHKPHYARSCVRAVKAMFAWAARDVAGREPRRILQRDPVEGFASPAVGRMAERFAERSEAAMFLRFWRGLANRMPPERRRFERRTILLERMLVRTGCRPGEACGLRWDQVVWDGGRTSAGHTFARAVLHEHKTAGSTNKPRTIYLTPTLTRALRRAYEGPDRHPTHVFTHQRGPRGKADTPAEWGDPWLVGSLCDRVRKVRRRAIGAGVGLKDEGANRLTNYIFRHTAASTLIMQGIDISTVAELLGTSPEMLRLHYIHLLSDHLGQAAEALQGKRKGR